jgi:hypothetical protein
VSDDYSKMSRETAVKHFAARSKMLVHRIKAMPRAEQIRFAADLLDDPRCDARMRVNVVKVLQFVLSELKNEVG